MLQKYFLRILIAAALAVAAASGTYASFSDIFTAGDNFISAGLWNQESGGAGGATAAGAETEEFFVEAFVPVEIASSSVAAEFPENEENPVLSEEKANPGDSAEQLETIMPQPAEVELAVVEIEEKSLPEVVTVPDIETPFDLPAIEIAP